LKQIRTDNVRRLAAQWIFQFKGIAHKFEATPLVVDGIMYFPALDNRVFAIDARTGRQFWEYRRSLPEKMPVCCGTVSRGVAALGDRIFLATVDGHVVALDSKTGNLLWDAEAGDVKDGHSFTLAPLVVNDKVVVGVSGGEFGLRGYIDAYQADTGKRAWRFYTIPGPGEAGHETWEGDSWKHGGAPAWLTGTYDPDSNLIYWGTGNPAPDFYGDEREGDNLYSNSVVALEPDNGKLKWHFQFTPHDVNDYDATQIPVLLDLDWKGKPRKLLATANRNGFFYLLDRTNGEFLLAKQLLNTTWANGIDRNGRPIINTDNIPDEKGKVVCPGLYGATNWMSPSYSPVTRLFYVVLRQECFIHVSKPQHYEPGKSLWGGSNQEAPGMPRYGAVRALDPLTGESKWEFKLHSTSWGGTLSTAGGLLFVASEEGYLIALDALTGEELWHFRTGGGIYASPMSFAVDGRQYIVIPCQNALIAFAIT